MGFAKGRFGFVFTEDHKSQPDLFIHLRKSGVTPPCFWNAAGLLSNRMNHVIAWSAATGPRNVPVAPRAVLIDVLIATQCLRRMRLGKTAIPLAEGFLNSAIVRAEFRPQLGVGLPNLFRSRLRLTPDGFSAAQRFEIPCIRHHIFMACGEELGVVFSTFFPNYLDNKVLLPKHLIHQRPQMMHLIVINRDEDRAVVGQQLAQELQPREHHAAPLVVAGEIVAVHRAAQPVAHHRRVDLVVVNPALVAGVVGRVDVDALHLAVKGRQQRLERLQVVALDDEIVVQARALADPARLYRLQLAERDDEMVVLHQRFAFELECRHGNRVC